MKNMNLIPSKPDFSSWPLSKSLKILLLSEAKWPEYLAINASGLAMILNTFSEQVKLVNFFNNPPETSLFFSFLRKLVESKPQNNDVLKGFSQITSEILDKFSEVTCLNKNAEMLATHYLNLLALMLEPRYRYLFEKAEISIWTNDFQKISNTSHNSSAFLSHFRNTLQLSFQSIAFIKNYPALIRTIRELACFLDKENTDTNELQAMKLFDTLGVLDQTLKTTQVYQVKINRATINQSIQATRDLLYDQFKPYVEENLLQFIVYKSYLAQAYPNVTNLTAICDSENYRMHCQSGYSRFKDNYRCPTGQMPHFSINIKNNNYSKLDLDRLCAAMRSVESFVPWMENFRFKKIYNTSQYFLHVTDTKKNFLIDKFLFESDDPPETSHRVLATYFQPKKPSYTGPLAGSTYTYTNNPSVLTHEYIHHLYALFIKDLEQDLTLTEGTAELYSDGICSKRNINNLRNYVNDTYIFEFLKARRYPFYFNALKWVAYLVNEQPELFATLVNSLQNDDIDSFYATIDSFISNDSNRQAFVDWSYRQVNTCNHYLSIFPDGHQSQKIYLEDIQAYLNQTNNCGLPNVILTKRDILSQNAEFDLYQAVEKSYGSEDFWQGIQVGIPLRLAALFAGMTSSFLDDVGLIYKENCPSLPAYINNGFKPFVFAAVSAGLNTIFYDQAVVDVEEKFARLFVYFMMNYLGVIIGQPLNKKLAEKIQNKVLNFFIQMMTWTMLWNPSLFLSESSRLFPTLFLQITQALCFKVGEETYQMGKRICSPFWNRKNPQALDTEEAFLDSNNDEELIESKVSLKFS